MKYSHFTFERVFLEDQLLVVWDEGLNIVKEKIGMPSYRTWLSKLQPIDFKNNVFSVSTPNKFTHEWLEKNYRTTIEDALKEILIQDVKVNFLNNNSESSKRIVRETEVSSAQKTNKSSQNKSHYNRTLNPKYTFSSFVIGDSNRFAYAAALAVAENPAKSYNPLFIYGGVGLGKTHLLHAIADYVLIHNPHLKVKYVSSEKFTNDFINSIGDKDKIPGFHKKYRSVDVLLVDDIQFLEKKEATQTEFFHTFNTLYSANKQIIISSDRPPKEISTLEDRLRSRFEWGLITDVLPPDLETRIAILRKKASNDGLEIPGDALEYIASNIKSNIRELEGALIRVVAYSSLTKAQITLDLTKEVLLDIITQQESKIISISNILEKVSNYFTVPKTDILSAKRSQNVVYPRQIAMYLSRELTDHSLPHIGQEFGGRDHTTVIHANNKIQNLLKEQRQVYNEIQELTNMIKQN